MWRTEESVYIEEYRRGLWEVCNEIFASFLPNNKPCVINSPCTVGGIKKNKSKEGNNCSGKGGHCISLSIKGPGCLLL